MTRRLVISYVPLLDPRDCIGTDGNIDLTLLKERSADIAYNIRACLWIKDDEGLLPVLIAPNATALFDHLMYWSEGEPEQWFKLYFTEVNDNYAISLHPIIDRTTERFKLRSLLEQQEIVADEEITDVVYEPLVYVSTSKVIFSQVKSSLGERCRLGFVDCPADRSRDIAYLKVISEDQIKVAGPFEIGHDSEIAEWAKNIKGDSDE